MLTQVISEKFEFISLPKINWRRPCVSGLILIAPLLIFYLFQINAVTKASFIAYQQEKELTLSFQQARDLEAGLLAESHLVNLDDMIRSYNYEKVNKVHYIQIQDGEMAVRR